MKLTVQHDVPVRKLRAFDLLETGDVFKFEVSSLINGPCMKLTLVAYVNLVSGLMGSVQPDTLVIEPTSASIVVVF